MGKNKTNIKVITVYDGELDATDVFVSLIAQKYQERSAKNISKEYLAKTQDIVYNDGEVQKSRKPSGLCG